MDKNQRIKEKLNRYSINNLLLIQQLYKFYLKMEEQKNRNKPITIKINSSPRRRLPLELITDIFIATDGISYEEIIPILSINTLLKELKKYSVSLLTSSRIAYVMAGKFFMNTFKEVKIFFTTMRCIGCNRRLIYGLNYNANRISACFSCCFPVPPVPIPPENLKKRGKVSLQQTDDGFCPICHKYITRKNWARHVRNMHNKYYKEHGGVFSNSFAGYTTSTQEKPLFSLSFQNLRELNYENQERTSPSTSVLDVEVTKSFDIPSIQFMQDYYGEDRTFPQFSEELTEDRPPSSVTTSVIISSISDFLEERDVTESDRTN
ncbi:hypothetical protein Mgra_00008378 [Meloidogyne graminicola]|uniref:Uncharacterized protein n=1 Tax=Meloidogyne graminicola TaxID=189291 RepID=A0A8S9ZFV0_9BILA|nr:hypothetical protein Mgra_00008378 [Meloidogyne graminicola]